MNARDWFDQMGSEGGFGAILDAARLEFGRGATRWLADTMGVNIRQAQRWYKGETRPGRDAMARFPGGPSGPLRSAIAAVNLAKVHRIKVGSIDVFSLSDGAPDGSRKPPTLDVGGVMGEVAALVHAGRLADAEELFDRAVLNAYEGRDLRDDDGLGAVLGISDYASGIEVVD